VSREFDRLFEFCKRHPAFRPLVVTRSGDKELARRLGVQAMSWIHFLTKDFSPS
jgi:hypothetical protein